MKIGELIEELELLKDRRGDGEVYVSVAEEPECYYHRRVPATGVKSSMAVNWPVPRVVIQIGN